MKFLKDLLRKRQVKLGSTELIYTLFIVLILIILNFLASRHRYRWDLTTEKQYSLSQQTKQVLKNLKTKIEILAFYKQGERQKIADLLEEYKYCSKKINYRFIDPDRSPGETQLYGVEKYKTLILLTKGKKEKLENPEGEKDITNAILRIIQNKRKTIYFLSGHGEKNIDDTSDNGYSRLKEALKDQNYIVKKIALLRKKKIPNDCTVLAICGPQKALLNTEKQEVIQYINNGGHAIFMMDPYPAYGGEDLLKNWGIEVGNDIVIDKLSRLFGGDYFMPVITKYNPHKITENFNIASFFPLARSIYPLKTFKNDNIKVEILAETGEGSWAETDRKKAQFNPGKDKKGPISLVVAVSKKQSKGKNNPLLVVFGDSDFVANRYINLSGNKDFFLNCLNWLAEEKELIAIGPKPKKSNIISLTVSQCRLIFYFCVIIVPLAILSLGVIIWYKTCK